MGARGAAVAAETETETGGIGARVEGRQAEIGTTVTGGAATVGVAAPPAQISSLTRRCPGTLRRKWSSR